MDLKSLTSRKIAGIPVIYLILGVVVVALYAAIKMRSTEDAPEDTGDEEDSFAGDTIDTSQPVFAATPTIIQPSGAMTSTGASVSAVPQQDTDDLWKRRAIEYLRQNGYSLDVATAAITKYLNGDALTTTEAQARDLAVQNFGLPPEGIPETSTIPKTPDAPKPTPVTPTTPVYTGPASKQGTPPLTHVVRGTSDDSFGELARLYYGIVGDGSGSKILLRSANVNLKEPFAKNTRVYIPKFVQPKYYKATSATRTIFQIAKKNGTTVQRIQGLNPDIKFPAKIGQRVRVR